MAAWVGSALLPDCLGALLLTPPPPFWACLLTPPLLGLQSRYMVGEIKHSFVVGFGTRAPEHINEAASSCPRSASAACTSDAQFAEGPNPWTLRGALVRGPYSNDILVDSRTSTQTYVQVGL